MASPRQGRCATPPPGHRTPAATEGSSGLACQVPVGYGTVVGHHTQTTTATAAPRAWARKGAMPCSPPCPTRAPQRRGRDTMAGHRTRAITAAPGHRTTGAARGQGTTP